MTDHRLNTSNLATMPKNISVPRYNPKQHASGIVHIGIGAFHKAHQAVYTDDVLNLHGGDWRITAVSLRNPTARDQLKLQDGLYSVAEKNDAETHLRIIGSVEKVLVAPENPEAVITLLADESIKIVSLTITEKGYCQSGSFNTVSLVDTAKKINTLDLLHPDIQHDLQNPTNPTTMPGFIVAACAQRKKNQRAGFTVISCDNLSHNGRITRAVVIEFADQINTELADWIRTHISFCSTMVDRIVPATTAQDIADACIHLGIEDQAAVICEPFRQWVIEDNFCNDRPRWEDAGALIVKEVTVFENMKLRLLNGSHSALAYLGFLSGHQYIHQAIAEPALNLLIKKLMDEEVTPTLNVPKDFEIEQYKKIIRERFANSQAPYKTTQVANDGSQKLPQRLLTTATELIQQGHYPATIALIIAAWFRFLEGEDSEGRILAVNDPLANQLTPLARMHRHDEKMQVDLLIKTSGIFSDALVTHPQFKNDVAHWLAEIHNHGTAETIKSFLNRHQVQ